MKLYLTKLVLIASFLLALSNTTEFVNQNASGHGVNNIEQQSNLIRIADESFSSQTLSVGGELIITGKIIAVTDIDITEPISIYAESSNTCNTWKFLFKDPSQKLGHLSTGTELPYLMRIAASEQGVYHVHSMVKIDGFGESLGKGQTVVVSGGPDVPVYCQAENQPMIITGIVAGLGGGFVVFILIRRYKGKPSPFDDKPIMKD